MSEHSTQPKSENKNGRAEAPSQEAAARQRQARGRAADRAAGGGAEARRRPLVLKGIRSASCDPHHHPDGPERSSTPVIEPSKKRLLSDRARALIAETCGDIAEAAKLIGCGTRVRRNLVDVAVERHADGYAFTTGLQTCGSVWSCPICSYKIRVKRAAEIATAIARHRAAGGTVLLLTLTTQHSAGEALDTVWSSVQDAWQYITAHYRYRKLRDELGIGFVRTVEVMHGANGWHPHLHLLLFVDTPVDPFDTPDEYRSIAQVFHDLWVRRMETKHARDVRSSVGVDLRPVKDDGADGVGMYCMKAGYEVALADGKVGRTSTSRHPFTIAYDAVETGDMADVRLFREWVRSSHGRRMWTWSQGLREKLRLGAEKDDEELAAEAEVSVERICTISPTLWRAIILTRIGLRSRFLAVLDGGPDCLMDGVELLASHGIGVVIESRSDGAPRLRAFDEPSKPTKPEGEM